MTSQSISNLKRFGINEESASNVLKEAQLTDKFMAVAERFGFNTLEEKIIYFESLAQKIERINGGPQHASNLKNPAQGAIYLGLSELYKNMSETLKSKDPRQSLEYFQKAYSISENTYASLAVLPI